MMDDGGTFSLRRVALVGLIWGILFVNRRIAAAHCTGNQMGGRAELQLARWPEGPRFQAVGLDFGGLGCFSTEGM
jgi:hypothetical protein